MSLIEKNYNEFKLRNNKQSVEETLTEKAEKATIQVLYITGLFDIHNFGNADEVSNVFLLIERRRPDLEELNEDNVIKRFHSYIQFEKIATSNTTNPFIFVFE